MHLVWNVLPSSSRLIVMSKMPESVVPIGYEEIVRRAVSHYWATLGAQGLRQRDRQGDADRGNRGAVTGGRQMDGFCSLVKWLVAENGMPEASIFAHGRLEIPGYFRPTKKWDLLVVHRKQLVAAVEFKSQVGPSFGNNFNNRTEEALGTATDIWTAYREGAFGPKAIRPWIGWLMFLEDCTSSERQVGSTSNHFDILEAFRNTSYRQRYEIMLRRMVLEKLYDGAALILSCRPGSSTNDAGDYVEPSDDLSMKRFLAGLGGNVRTFLASM